MIFKTYQRERNPTSIYRGVSFVKKRAVNPWRAKLAGKILGYFATPEEAAKNYDAVSIATLGAQFAITNFPIEP